MKKPIYRVMDNGTYQLSKGDGNITHVLLRDTCRAKLDTICSKLNVLPYYTESDAIEEYYRQNSFPLCEFI